MFNFAIVWTVKKNFWVLFDIVNLDFYTFNFVCFCLSRMLVCEYCIGLVWCLFTHFCPSLVQCYFYFKKYHWHWLMDFLLLEYTSVKMKNDWCIFPYRMYFSQMTEGFSTLRNSISQWTEPILEMLSHLKKIKMWKFSTLTV